MASDFVKALIQMGHHMDHPEAKALHEGKEGVKAPSIRPGAEYPKMLYHPTNPLKKGTDGNSEYDFQLAHSPEEEADLLEIGWVDHPGKIRVAEAAPAEASPDAKLDPPSA